MVGKVTDDVINALQHCRLKAYFRLRGEEGAQSGYEKLLVEQRANAQRKATEKVWREYRESEVATDLNLSVANLRRNAMYLFERKQRGGVESARRWADIGKIAICGRRTE